MLLYFYIVKTSLEVLEKLSGRNIKIFLISNPEEFLARRLDYFNDCPFEKASLKFDSKIDSDCKIIKNGKGFHILIGGNALCANNNKVITCSNKMDKWIISSNSIGFTFKKNKLCLNFENRNLELKECTQDANQLFDFLTIPHFISCLEDNSFNQPIDEKQMNKEIKKLEFLNEANDNLTKLIDEKKPINSFEDFAAKTFSKPEDKKKAKKLAKLGKLWSWGNRPKWKFPSINFLDFICPS
ncbi:hypothetical protein H312_02879 [Anncaliia algerae PRA339]|uniref:Uncharacterized protein n=1 Tax=Anncaliia algerae PRA339 TaxID=1288291 RepID=A0A059EYD7_9MICR|nr:hypothetical protein H312_02879 [Anncaliia algerae PRA339]